MPKAFLCLRRPPNAFKGVHFRTGRFGAAAALPGRLSCPKDTKKKERSLKGYLQTGGKLRFRGRRSRTAGLRTFFSAPSKGSAKDIIYKEFCIYEH